jgi:hypothetical protein
MATKDFVPNNAANAAAASPATVGKWCQRLRIGTKDANAHWVVDSQALAAVINARRISLHPRASL